jgi:hypothetical protein
VATKLPEEVSEVKTNTIRESMTHAARNYESVEEIGTGLFDLSLPHHLWTHEAHLAAAVYVLMVRTELDASEVMPWLIRRYNKANGVENSDTGGFHATITEFYIRTIRAFLDFMPAGSTPDQAFEKLLQSEIADRAFPLNYYAPEVLFSTRARRRWIDPGCREFSRFYMNI